MYNHNKAQQSKNRVHISWDILYEAFQPGKQRWCLTLRSVAWRRRKSRVINVRTNSKLVVISVSISKCMIFPRDAKCILPSGDIIHLLNTSLGNFRIFWICIQSNTVITRFLAISSQILTVNNRVDPPTTLGYLCAIYILPILHLCHCTLYEISCYVEQCYHEPLLYHAAEWLLMHFVTETKWPPFCTRHVKIHFSWIQSFFYWNISDLCCQESSWKQLSIGSGQTSHYLNQLWPRLLMHICVSQPQWVNSLLASCLLKHQNLVFFHQMFDVKFSVGMVFLLII